MSEDFLKLTEELVSNESTKREAALEKAKHFLQTIPNNSEGHDLMSKLWKNIKIKQVHFQILRNMNCQELLVLKA